MPSPAQLSSTGRAFVLREEGVDQPTVWPGESSGITIGPGYDLSSVTHAEFADDWKDHLSASDFARLDACVGLSGKDARQAALTLKGIVISMSVAIAIFDAQDVPEYTARTVKTFPGSDRLPQSTFDALFSLVYNRGTSLVGPTRAEMYAISAITSTFDPVRLNDTLRSIAHQIRSMKRRWLPTSGLYGRREREAAMVEAGLTSSSD